MAEFQGIGVEVIVDEQSLRRAAQDLIGFKNGVERVANGAVTKTLAKSKTMVIRQLAGVLTAKTAVIRKSPNGAERIVTTPVHSGSGSLRILGRRIGAINFEWHRTSEGIVVKYFRQGGKEIFEGRDIFVGVGKPSDRGEGGNRQLFERVKGSKSRVQTPHYLPNKGKMRERIGSISGLSLYDVYKGKSKWSAELQKFMQDDVKEQFLSQTDRLLGRSKSERTST